MNFSRRESASKNRHPERSSAQRNAVEGPLTIPASLSSSPSNPLLALPQEQKENIFIWLREGSDHDAINLRLRDPTTLRHQRRNQRIFHRVRPRTLDPPLDRAAQEADAIISQVRRNPGQIPEAILVALGQEAFAKSPAAKSLPRTSPATPPSFSAPGIRPLRTRPELKTKNFRSPAATPPKRPSTPSPANSLKTRPQQQDQPNQ